MGGSTQVMAKTGISIFGNEATALAEGHLRADATGTTTASGKVLRQYTESMVNQVMGLPGKTYDQKLEMITSNTYNKGKELEATAERWSVTNAAMNVIEPIKNLMKK
jgi:hypothetical protein